MSTLFFIGVGTLLLFSLYVIYKFGVQPSFSDSYYALGKKGWMFQLNMIVMTFSFTPVMLEISAGYWWQFLSFLAIAPIAFVGVAPKFKVKNSPERDVHMFAAKMSAIFSLLWVAMVGYDINKIVWLTIPLSALVMFVAYLINGKKNKIWWAEYICFSWTLMTMGILLPLI